MPVIFRINLWSTFKLNLSAALLTAIIAEKITVIKF
jgi:hypothetical protein